MKRPLSLVLVLCLLLAGLATTALAADSAPEARDDVYTFSFGSNQTKTALAGLFADNGAGADKLGEPVATLTSFGGGNTGGTVVANQPGDTISVGGGDLTVNADGSWSFLGAPFEPGVYTFRYRLTNSVGTSDALVTFTVRAAPTAADDALSAGLGDSNAFPAGTLFADNGNGPDDLGFPEATVKGFGGGDLGGGVVDNAPGDSVPFAGGTLTVRANGSLQLDAPTVLGPHTFLYRIGNAVGQADAGVTITVVDAPRAEDDSYRFMYNVNKNVAAGQGLFADNGNGADDLGNPPATLVSFGGGFLGGNVTTYAAGTSAALAGGTLTIASDGSWNLTGAPFAPGQYSFKYRLESSSGSSTARVYFYIEAPPLAKDDALVARIGETASFPAETLFNNNGSGVDDRGYPTAVISHFGGGTLGGSVTSNTAGSTVPFVGGTLQINADGSITIANPTSSGTYTVIYRLSNSVSSSDASITIRVAKPPQAKDDSYTFNDNAVQNFGPAGGLFKNNGSGADDLGIPDAVLSSFGGGALGGTVTSNLAGSAVSLAGGTLIVNSDGSWSLNGTPFVPGNYTFSYRLSNAGGTSDATVTLNIQGPPQAQDDQLGAPLGGTVALPPGALFSDNGNGPDSLGFPAGTLTSFGGGALGGSVTKHNAGSAVAFAGGTLTVNGVGSITIANPSIPGSYTFNYRLTNPKGTSDATVTVLVAEPPRAEDDAYTFQYDAEQNVPVGSGLLTDNGNGADFLGTPTATLTSFGGGSLGGTVTALSPGESTVLAKGTLTVNADGSWSLTGAPFSPGTYTFFYRLSNDGGVSDAEVTLTIEAVPQAQDDDLAALAQEVTAFAPGTLFNDNGFGADELGFPVATLTSFGGGDLGGDVTDNLAGSTVAFAGGTLVVNTVGSFTVTNPIDLGVYTFQYRIANAEGSSEATVTLTILQAPVKVDVYLPALRR